MSRFVDDENAARLPAYHKAPDDEAALLAANQALAGLEPSGPPGPERPTIFVVGLPRSGTTLCAQLLAACLDVGYISNLAARFWLAPAFGVRLSRLVLGDRRDHGFTSDYGKSNSPTGVHEFAYFWQRLLGIETLDDLLRFGRPNTVDWAAGATAVRRLVDAAAAPVLFKTNYAAQFLADFAAWMPQPLFVHVERDPADVALSILAARRAYYGRDDAWWGTHPPEYHDLAGLPVAEQVAGQVTGLRRAYALAAGDVDPRLCVTIDYAAMCADPGGFLDTVRRRVLDLHGVSIDQVASPPALRCRAQPRNGLDPMQLDVLRAVHAVLGAEEGVA
jgi:hypothetical protein